MAIAKVPTVSNFFCYFELSTGGLVLGCFDAAVYGLVLLGLVINLITGMAIISSERLNKFSLLGEIFAVSPKKVLSLIFVLRLRTYDRCCGSIGSAGSLSWNRVGFHQRGQGREWRFYSLTNNFHNPKLYSRSDHQSSVFRSSYFWEFRQR